MSLCTQEGSNIKTKMFWVHAENCYNGCLSHKCTGRLFQRRGPSAAKLLSPNVLCVRGIPKPSVCCQPSTEVPGLTKTSKRNMPALSQHVSAQEANATDEELARFGPLVWFQWEAEWRHSVKLKEYLRRPKRRHSGRTELCWWGSDPGSIK